jgi:hypothetical protein
MKFCEAMDKLKNGSKVTRKPWGEGLYFLMQGEDVKSFQPKLSSYHYNEDIMVSDGWLVDDCKEEMKFCDIIPYIRKGSKAKMKQWKESFIYFDNSTKGLVIHSMECFPFTPDFDSFLAEDWITIE